MASPGVISRATSCLARISSTRRRQQQTTLLRAMDDATMAPTPTTSSRQHIPEERDTQLKGYFWDVFKGITLHGYYTSEIGFTQEETSNYSRRLPWVRAAGRREKG